MISVEQIVTEPIFAFMNSVLYPEWPKKSQNVKMQVPMV